jgi:NADH-quinone oxidoreductase subunit I
MPATKTKSGAIQKYCKDVLLGLKTTAVGLRVTWGTMFEKKVTLNYPEERPVVPVGHRGIHGYDEELCISCDMCANACPVSCIYIQSVGKGQDALMTQFDIDYTKCLFCDLCTPPCPTECIWMTQEYDLASYTKDDCIINFARVKTADQIEEHKAKLAKMEEEKKAKAAARKAEAEAEAGGEGKEVSQDEPSSEDEKSEE